VKSLQETGLAMETLLEEKNVIESKKRHIDAPLSAPRKKRKSKLDIREVSWPSVLAKRKLSENDEKLIRKQLGYLPGNALQVVTRVSDLPCSLPGAQPEEPVVLLLYPMVVRERRGRRRKCKTQSFRPSEWPEEWIVEPFPTTYWTIHQVFNKLLSGIHVAPDMKWDEDRMKEAHKEYGKERWDLLEEADKRIFPSALGESRGVAGMEFRKSVGGIKSLHAHAGHWLSGSKFNQVGEWSIQELEKLVAIKKP